MDDCEKGGAIRFNKIEVRMYVSMKLIDGLLLILKIGLFYYSLFCQ